VDKQQIIEGIDACRPGSSDLHSAEFFELADRLQAEAPLRNLYDRVQQLDARLNPAMHEVAVPAGLVDRLLAALAAESAEASPELNGAAPVDAVVTLPASLPIPGVSRRRWLLASLATAAGLLVAATLAWHYRPTVEQPIDVAGLGESLYSRVNEQWRSIASAPVALRFPNSLIPAHGWQAVEDNGEKAVAFDLSHGPARGVLFVLRRKLPRLQSSTPTNPQYSTGGRAIAAWESNGLSYVLVVEDERSYRSFFKTSAFAETI